jgi:enoyl-CoA hydratase
MECKNPVAARAALYYHGRAMSNEYTSLTLEFADGIADVVLRGPGKGNAMGPDFWREMPDIFTTLDQDETVRAVIIRGDGKHFSYGLDVMAMMNELGPLIMGDNLAAGRTRLLELIGRMQQATNHIAHCRKPVIAAIHGWCIGGGLDVIAACDIRLCSADAKFSLREVKLAIVADIGSLQRLPHIIGDGHTRELAFTGKDIDANHALRIGLVNDVYATPEALLAAARAMARDIADNPPLVVQGIKQVMNYRTETDIADQLRYGAVWNSAFLQSSDLAEAIAALAERRAPRFQGQ